MRFSIAEYLECSECPGDVRGLVMRVCRSNTLVLDEVGRVCNGCLLCARVWVCEFVWLGGYLLKRVCYGRFYSGA